LFVELMMSELMDREAVHRRQVAMFRLPWCMRPATVKVKVTCDVVVPSRVEVGVPAKSFYKTFGAKAPRIFFSRQN
jgi:hypothetical protein